MSGHNKWSQIKRQKEKTDSQKAKLFGKFGKLLAQEVKFILSEHGTSLASQGSASWAFTRNNHEWTASTTIPLEDADVEKLNLLVEALEENEEVQAVYTNAE